MGGRDFSNDHIDVIVKATTSQYWATVFDGADAAAKKLGVQLSKARRQRRDRRRAGGLDHGERDPVEADRHRDRRDQRPGAGPADRRGDRRRHPGDRDRFRRQHRQIRDLPRHQQCDRRREGGRRTRLLRQGAHRQGGGRRRLHDRARRRPVAERPRQGLRRGNEEISGPEDRRPSHRQQRSRHARFPTPRTS